MDATPDDTHFRLLNDFQRGFPISARPYAELAAELNISEGRVIEMLQGLREHGAIGRVGAVFAPGVFGAGTLAALPVPADRIEAAAAIVNSHPEVNHNYQRDHPLSLWFVVTAGDMRTRDHVLRDIALETGFQPISLPLVEEYHIDLGFDLRTGAVPMRRRGPTRPRTRGRLTGTAARIAAALEHGLPLTCSPFEGIAAAAGTTESVVLDTVRQWLDCGAIRRFGVVVRHHRVGIAANAMVVWKMPAQAAATYGPRLAGTPGVSLCYRRRTHPGLWPYSVYCMVHARDETALAGTVDQLRQQAPRHSCIVLRTVRAFKQTGARYFSAPEHVVHG